MRFLRLGLFIAIAISAAGCVLPPALTIATYAIDGISLVVSGKSVSDHAISVLARKDCRMWRVLKGSPICQPETTVVAVARLPPMPLRAASAGTRPPELHAALAAPAVAPPSIAAAPPAPEQGPIAAPIAPQGGIPALIAPIAHPVQPPSPPAAQTTGTRRQAAVASQTPPSPALPAPRRASSETGARGEMVIRSGTDEAEARALADDLGAVGAIVRPARHGDIVIYEVVMGL